MDGFFRPLWGCSLHLDNIGKSSPPVGFQTGSISANFRPAFSPRRHPPTIPRVDISVPVPTRDVTARRHACTGLLSHVSTPPPRTYHAHIPHSPRWLKSLSYRAFSGYIRVQFGRPFGYISDGFLSDYIGFIRMDSGGNLSERTAPGWLMNGANRHLTEPNSGPLGGPEFGGLGAQKSTGQAGINPALARA